MKIILSERCWQLVRKCDIFLCVKYHEIHCKKATMADGVWVGLC